MRNAGCGMSNAECGVRDAGCGERIFRMTQQERDAECGVRDAGKNFQDDKFRKRANAILMI